MKNHINRFILTIILLLVASCAPFKPQERQSPFSADHFDHTDHFRRPVTDDLWNIPPGAVFDSHGSFFGIRYPVCDHDYAGSGAVLLPYYWRYPPTIWNEIFVRYQGPARRWTLILERFGQYPQPPNLITSSHLTDRQLYTYIKWNINHCFSIGV